MTDDLIARARAHADLHPESAALINELLDPPRCETCKHWKEEVYPGTTERAGLCNAADMESVGVKFETFTAIGYYGYGAQLETGPTFGCVEHEPS